MLKIHSLDTFGTHDGPGIRLVIFVQGCPFRCVYCHNPDTQALTTDKMQLLDTAEILELLTKEKSYFGVTGGLTISGGEPTLQAPALIELFRECHRHGFNTCLDTCGAIFNQTINELYDLTDIVMLDVKHIDPIWHQKITQNNNENVLANALYREKSGKELWLRYVLVPGWSNQVEYLEAWAKYFADYKSLKRVEIIPYHKLGVFKYEALGRKYELEGVQPPNGEEIDQALIIFSKYLGNKVVVV
ncbi:MAG TPA: pyruvate formate-lyase-activating protein [Candidatus Woesebacteria bacterium]|nr:pyruvate formate-lyase-activating protein [Candidatus Woesebacteria bacterium]